MAIQFDMSKNNWQKDYLAQERMAELGKNLGTGLGVFGEKVIPAAGKTLLGAAIGGSKKLFPEGGKKIGENSKNLLSKLFPQGGKKIKQGADTVVDLFIGDKDMLDQFEGSQDSPLMGFIKSKAQKQKAKFQGKKRERLLEKAKSGSYYKPSPEDESDSFDIGTDAANYGFNIPTAYQQELAYEEEKNKTNQNWETLPRPVTPDYIIEDELREKEKRDNLNRKLTSPSEIGQKLYGKKGALDDAMLNQNYGPLQQIMLLQQMRPSTTEQQIMEMYK